LDFGLRGYTTRSVAAHKSAIRRSQSLRSNSSSELIATSPPIAPVRGDGGECVLRAVSFRPNGTTNETDTLGTAARPTAAFRPSETFPQTWGARSASLDKSRNLQGPAEWSESTLCRRSRSVRIRKQCAAKWSFLHHRESIPDRCKARRAARSRRRGAHRLEELSPEGHS
jgi:hypothetical protein